MSYHLPIASARGTWTASTRGYISNPKPNADLRFDSRSSASRNPDSASSILTRCWLEWGRFARYGIRSDIFKLSIAIFVLPGLARIVEMRKLASWSTSVCLNLWRTPSRMLYARRIKRGRSCTHLFVNGFPVLGNRRSNLRRKARQLTVAHPIRLQQQPMQGHEPCRRTDGARDRRTPDPRPSGIRLLHPLRSTWERAVAVRNQLSLSRNRPMSYSFRQATAMRLSFGCARNADRMTSTSWPHAMGST